MNSPSQAKATNQYANVLMSVAVVILGGVILAHQEAYAALIILSSVAAFVVAAMFIKPGEA